MKHKALALLLIVMIPVTFSGCAKKAQQTSAVIRESSVKAAVTVAKPQDAVDAIYASLGSYKAKPVTSADLSEIFEIESGAVKQYYGMLSESNEGLADVLILLPDGAKHDTIQLALSKYKEKRMAEFENYDILDAYAISQNAVIYPQGGYIIMLMLSDNDTARGIIDEYIPL